MDDRRSESALSVSGESETVVAVMGGATRQGNWEPQAKIHAVAVMGGVKLDFREADMLEGVTEVELFACMGGVEIIVPPDINVNMDGFGLMGGFEALRRTSHEYDVPTLRVRGFALMGGATVKVKAIGEDDDIE
jgi:hypothetical protein